jgi:hypothetical protein
VCRGTGVTIEIGGAHDSTHEQRAVRAPEQPTGLGRARSGSLEDVVERADRASKQCVTPPE